jgi:hypothetical protein
VGRVRAARIDRRCRFCYGWLREGEWCRVVYWAGGGRVWARDDGGRFQGNERQVWCVLCADRLPEVAG